MEVSGSKWISLGTLLTDLGDMLMITTHIIYRDIQLVYHIFQIIIGQITATKHRLDIPELGANARAINEIDDDIAE